MAFLGSLLGIMGQLGRVVPNYVQGYRQAWQDNWNDANQYNQVQRGQLANLFAEAAFPYEFNMLADRAATSRAQANQAAGNFGIYAANYPYLMQSASINGSYAPYLAYLNNYYNANPGLRTAAEQLNLHNMLAQNGFPYGSPLGQTQWYQQQMAQQAATANAFNNIYTPPVTSTPAPQENWWEKWGQQSQPNVP